MTFEVFNWLLLAIYSLVVVSVMVKVLLDNRQPAPTMAWLLVLGFLPIVGIILYFFFGQNTRKERHISEKSMDLLTQRSVQEYVEQTDLHLPEEHRVLIQLFANLSWALPYKDNEVEVYTDGYGFFLELLQQIGKARHHIHLMTYIIEDDALGRLLSDALIDKVKEGVEVRLMYDDVGAWKTKNKFFNQLQAAGIEVCSFMPVHFPMFTSKVNYRNHRKLCIIDGKVGFVGGMNIALRYVKGTKKQAWRDTHLSVRGGVVYAIQRAFLMDWYFMTRTLINDDVYYPEQDPMISNDCIAQLVTSGPISPWPDMMQGYMRVLLEAKNYVYMETPYFVPTEPILYAMKIASQAGVDVRLMIPKHADTRLAQWAGKPYLASAMEAGVKVYYYTAGFNHSKLLVCDDSLCTCGSTNIDIRSFENNFESNVFFYDRKMALKFKEIFMEDLRHCVVADEQEMLHRRSYLKRLWEGLTKLLAPLL
ncbi:MAG: cardiolipin synthase [Prevotella sp.]|nr:cardiolipin synthase [Prevotellaceae bacterium]MDY3364496.1 cardiolipin synthase [Prevotella sp.]MDY3852280.1 cardiolipin synthase [Prevotella sp.]